MREIIEKEVTPQKSKIDLIIDGMSIGNEIMNVFLENSLENSTKVSFLEAIENYDEYHVKNFSILSIVKNLSK